MRILVTGGAGFIGSNFILYWLKKYPDDFIVNLDKLTYAGNLSNLKDISGNNNYQFIKGDICNRETVDESMKGVDIVVHFAAETHVDRSITSPSDFINTNVMGTYILLDSAKRMKIRHFHHISTDEVFGSLDLSSKCKFDEKTPYKPRSPYAASKASSDHLVYAYYETYGINITITNCSNNYGPFQHPEKLIPLTITNILEGKKIPVYGDGANVRDWLYVDDHCRAIDMVINKGKIGETYCVGGLNDDISNISIIKKIIKILNKDESLIYFVNDRPGHDRKYAVNWSKIRNELGWKPLHNLDECLIKTVDWYKKNILWWKALRNSNFEKYYKDQYLL